jgi:hypothetical protein
MYHIHTAILLYILIFKFLEIYQKDKIVWTSLGICVEILKAILPSPILATSYAHPNLIDLITLSLSGDWHNYALHCSVY